MNPMPCTGPRSTQAGPGAGLDWVDAGIGAAGMLGLGIVALVGVVAVRNRRHAPTAPAR